MRKLKPDNVVQQTIETLNKELKTISEYSNHETEIEDLWNKIKTVIILVREEELRLDNIAKEQQWMRDFIYLSTYGRKKTTQKQG